VRNYSGDDGLNWLTRSFSQYTVIWLVVSSLVGGLIGSSVRFLFEDILRPRIGWQRETAQVVRRYTAPLIRSAEALERRINILVRNEKHRWFDNDEYFRLSTLFAFGEFLGWVRLVERRFGFLPFESSRRGRQFDRRLNGLFRALSSHAYFRWHADQDSIDASEIPRGMLRAIGEVMTASNDDATVMEFTDFSLQHTRDDQFRRWFLELDTFLRRAHPEDELRWDRLILAGANLRALIRFMDPTGSMVTKRFLANVDLIAAAEVRRQLQQEFPRLV